MLSQQPVLELLKQCYEQVLEPRIRSLVESDEIATRADFDHVCEQLDVTREQLASMDWEMVLRSIREG